MAPDTRPRRGRTLPLDPHDELVARRVLTRCGLRGPDLEDSVQDLQLRALRHAPPEEDLGPWVARVAHNLAMDHHRNQRRRRNLDARLILGLPATTDAPDHLTPLVMAEALRNLGPEQRNVLFLRFLAGHSTTEIAAKLGIAEGTVKSRQHRALTALRPVLMEQDLRWTA